MGLTLFKRKQRYQGGSEAVPSDLPTPPEPPEAYQSPAVRSLLDQVRQGILPDESLAEIRQNPTSLRSLAAYGEGALGIGTLLSGGEGGKVGGELHGKIGGGKDVIPSSGSSGGRVPGISDRGVTEGDMFGVRVSRPSESMLVRPDARIKEAAYRLPDGTVLSAAEHGFILDKYPEIETNPHVISGFLNEDGAFVHENVAHKISMQQSELPSIQAPKFTEKEWNETLDDILNNNKSSQGYVRGTKTVKGYPPTHMLNCC